MGISRPFVQIQHAPRVRRRLLAGTLPRAGAKSAGNAAAANLAAMYLHFARQSAYVVELLEERVTELRRMGEEAYNSLQMGGRVSGAAPEN